MKIIFSKADTEQILASGMTVESVLSEISVLKKGIPFVKLLRPCVPSDGIRVIEREDIGRLNDTFVRAASLGRVMKFVPASGAASRMFESLVHFYDKRAEVAPRSVDQFINNLKSFAFYKDLELVISRQGMKLESLIMDCRYDKILKFLLTSSGLNYANIPKGIIKFHRHNGRSVTALEEHIVEGLEYAQDKDKVSRVHFTVGREYEKFFRKYVDGIRDKYEVGGRRCEISFSIQNRATDSIAVDMYNEPFRDKNGSLVFRPSGHGALLENLSDLNGDIVFIKNIDNVAQGKIKSDMYLYKKVLGGYLVELQDRIFNYISKLKNQDVDTHLIEHMFEFARHTLCITPASRIYNASNSQKKDFLFSVLNKPLRVCGMVKNTGESGGGPFWVEGNDESASLQIVEKAQVDFMSVKQISIFESSTHFNPVDIVCGVRDYMGRPFSLIDFRDPRLGFIVSKTRDGKKLKSLELPGLWNGSMANWNTVFVEVPVTTFNPVKTVFDLLRKSHQ